MKKTIVIIENFKTFVSNNTKKVIIIIAGTLSIVICLSIWFFWSSESQEVNNGEQVKSAEQQRIKELEQKVESLEGLNQAEIDAEEAERLKAEEDFRIKEQAKLDEERAVKLREEGEVAEKEEIEECEEWQKECRKKIEKIEYINFDGEYEDVRYLDEADDQIEELKDLIDRWEDQTDCDRSDDSTKRDCDELDERIEQVEDDIDEIEDLAEEARKERDKLLDDECNDYDKSCE